MVEQRSFIQGDQSQFWIEGDWAREKVRKSQENPGIIRTPHGLTIGEKQ
jgi:hypothetical protein